MTLTLHISFLTFEYFVAHSIALVYLIFLITVPGITSCRVALSIIGMATFAILYLLRINMSVAVVCMTRSPAPSNTSINSSDVILLPTVMLPSNKTGNEGAENDVCGSLVDINDMGNIIVSSQIYFKANK